MKLLKVLSISLLLTLALRAPAQSQPKILRMDLYCQEVHADTLMCTKQEVYLVFKAGNSGRQNSPDTFAVKLSGAVYAYRFIAPYNKETGSRSAVDLWFGDRYEIKFLTRVDKAGMAVFISNSERMFPSFFLSSENICNNQQP